MRIAMIGLRAIGHNAGGVERAVEELSTRLVQRGHQVTVFCRTRYNSGQADEYKGVHLVNTCAIYTKHLEAITHTAGATLHALRGYNIVHFHAMGPSLFAPLPRLAGQSVVSTIHGLDFHREKWGPFAKTVLKAGAFVAGTCANKTIVVSRKLQQYYQERLKRESTYIPNGIPDAHAGSIQELRRFGVRGDDYLLFLGRLVPEKGCHNLIKAFRKTTHKHKLLIVGSSSHSDKYVKHLQYLAAGDNRIIFTGSLFGEAKHAAYTHASGLVFPSALEGMPLVLLEAMSHSCPVLCSNIAENLEVVIDYETQEPLALTYALNDQEALIMGIKQLISDPESNHIRAKHALQSGIKQFNWERIAAETEAVYQEALRS